MSVAPFVHNPTLSATCNVLLVNGDALTEYMKWILVLTACLTLVNILAVINTFLVYKNVKELHNVSSKILDYVKGAVDYVHEFVHDEPETKALAKLAYSI